MKRLLLPLAAVAALSLSGCAAYYGDPAYGGYGYGGPYAGNGYYGPVVPSVSVGVYGNTHGPARGWRDRDHDGVPNWADARPRDPRWR